MDDNVAVLIVDDDPTVIRALELALRRDYRVLGAESAAAARSLLARERVAVAVCDQRMPGETGIELFRWMKEEHPSTVRILLTGYSDQDDMLAAVNRGQVFRYLVKPWNNNALRMDLRNAVEHYRLARERDELLAHLHAENKDLNRQIERHSGGLLGKSEGLRRAIDDIDTVAPTGATVLIEGESGTGKELLARRLHRFSKRARRPFVAVNCGALSPNLVESELFGHASGAFTGARAREGMIRASKGGTLFLDEVGDLPLDLQTRLLRVLESSEVRPVGADRGEKVDLRVVAATHRDLDKLVSESKFRLDLLHRLKVFVVRVPPLRSRPADLELLLDHFLTLFGRPGQGISPEARSRLLSYDFPGNVRELRNLVEGAVLRARGRTVGLDCLPELAPSRELPCGRAATTYDEHCRRKIEAKNRLGDELDRSFLQLILDRSGGNIAKAGRDSGISRSHLHALLKRLRMDPSDFREPGRS